MFLNPARCSSPASARQQASHTRHGGKLARARHTQRGPFSFAHLADDLRTEGSDRHEAWASLRARGAGAATPRHVVIHAKSRPLPVLDVDHFLHGLVSFLHCGKYLEIVLRGRKSSPRARKILPAGAA